MCATEGYYYISTGIQPILKRINKQVVLLHSSGTKTLISKDETKNHYKNPAPFIFTFYYNLSFILSPFRPPASWFSLHFHCSFKLDSFILLYLVSELWPFSLSFLRSYLNVLFFQNCPFKGPIWYPLSLFTSCLPVHPPKLSWSALSLQLYSVFTHLPSIGPSKAVLIYTCPTSVVSLLALAFRCTL